MKKPIFFSLAFVAILAPNVALSEANSYTMPDSSFRQFVCSYLEGEANRTTAVSKIKDQIGSIINDKQENILDDIKGSETQKKAFCPGIE